MSVDAAKEAARQQALAARKKAHATARPDQADLLIQVLKPHVGKTIAGYYPIRSEIDPTAAMTCAATLGDVALPVIQGKGLPLTFHRWTPDAPLQAGPYGARIPLDGAPVTPEVLIVPLVAFDGHGNRLGYGGGYYDRTLERLRSERPTLAIGFAFAAQQIDDLPLEPTDQALDLIVTERAILRPNR